MKINTDRFRNRMRYSVLLFTVLWNLSRSNAVLPHCHSGQRIVCSSQNISTCQCSPITNKQGENCESTGTTLCGFTKISVTYKLQAYHSRAMKRVQVTNSESVRQTLQELAVGYDFGVGVEGIAEASFMSEVSMVNRNLVKSSSKIFQNTSETVSFAKDARQLWRKVIIKVIFGNGESSESRTEEYCDSPPNMTKEELNQRAIQHLKDYYAYEGEPVTGPVLTHYWSHPRRQLGAASSFSLRNRPLTSLSHNFSHHKQTKYGMNAVCSANSKQVSLVTGVCLSGAYGDCGRKYWTEITCDPIWTTTNGAIVEDKIYGKRYGQMAYCPDGYAVSELCGSGRYKDCKLNGRYYTFTFKCVRSSDIRMLSHDTIELQGDHGSTIDCPTYYVVTGVCGSGWLNDCGYNHNGLTLYYSHRIRCTKLA